VTSFNTLAIFLRQEGSAFPIGIVIQIAALAMIFWFLLIRPQRRMQQQHREMVAALKKGDEVMTEGGIIGSVVHLADDRITVRTGDTRVIVARAKIARVMTAPAEVTTAETKS
jgi:preprotein translocase subunit YajC